MCETLGISTRTYYKYRHSEDKDYYDYILIKEIFDENKRTYGYRRICDGLLAKYGVIFNHKKVARIMQKYGLKPEYIKRIRPSMYKRIEQNVKSNLLKRNFHAAEPNQIWLTDITYLIFENKRVYLSTIIDLYGERKVVAYKISKINNVALVIDTLNEAIAKTKDVRNLIIHSDQGFQYTSFEYKAICEANGITISMSRKGTPIDDSPMESFHSILKKETLYNNYITSLEEYIAIVKDWIEFYNTKRLKTRKGTRTFPR